MRMKPVANVIGFLFLLVAFVQAQGPKPVQKEDSAAIANRKDAPRIKADTKGNIVRKEGKTTPQPAVVKAKKDTVSTKSGLKYIDTKVGTGLIAEHGKMVEVHYVGWFYDKGVLGKKYVSSLESGQTFKYLLGRGMSIKGWEEGIVGMKVGGKRTLIVKPELAYGANGFRDMIPPNMGLVYEMELLGVSEPESAH